MFSVQAPPWRLALRLLAVLCLLACPRIGTAAGAWSVLSLPQQPGEVMSPTLVAVDGACVVFVEVRSTGGDDLQRPALSVDDAKQRRLTNLAVHFLQRHRLLDQSARFDVIIVSWTAGSNDD